jgi:hypothetical protein
MKTYSLLVKRDIYLPLDLNGQNSKNNMMYYKITENYTFVAMSTMHLMYSLRLEITCDKISEHFIILSTYVVLLILRPVFEVPTCKVVQSSNSEFDTSVILLWN